MSRFELLRASSARAIIRRHDDISTRTRMRKRRAAQTFRRFAILSALGGFAGFVLLMECIV